MAKSQKEMILSDLRKGDIITPLDALNRYDCMRLGGRIYEIRREIDPDTGKFYQVEMMPNKNGKRYAKYLLYSPKVRRKF